MRFRTGLAMACLLASVSVMEQGPRMDGKWEVTMEMYMPGMPMKMPPMTTTQCVTKEEAADPQKAVPQASKDQNCKVSDYKTTSNKVTWAVKCEGANPMTGSGEVVYTGDTFAGTMKMDHGGQAMNMKYSGKRLGDCTK